MEDIERYKTSLIKLWKQCCANQSLKINETVDTYAIKENIVKLNIKDNYVNDIIIKAFSDSYRSIDWSNYKVNNACYYYNVEKKKLSISKIIVDVNCYKNISYYKKEKGFFSNKDTINKYTIDMNDYYYNVDRINDIILYNSNQIVNFNKPVKFGGNSIMSVYFALLTYNNIFIPITLKEYDELRCFELECRKKDDMEDVYRNLTLLSPSEYKEFLIWMESKKVINEINPKNLEKAE